MNSNIIKKTIAKIKSLNVTVDEFINNIIIKYAKIHKFFDIDILICCTENNLIQKFLEDIPDKEFENVEIIRLAIPIFLGRSERRNI